MGREVRRAILNLSLSKSTLFLLLFRRILSNCSEQRTSNLPRGLAAYNHPPYFRPFRLLFERIRAPERAAAFLALQPWMHWNVSDRRATSELSIFLSPCPREEKIRYGKIKSPYAYARRHIYTRRTFPAL